MSIGRDVQLAFMIVDERVLGLEELVRELFDELRL